MPRPEKKVEDYLVRQIKKIGGIAYKFSSPGKRSVPDRLCVLPQGEVVFVECKPPGGEPTRNQYRELSKLKARGHWATWVNSKYMVDQLVAKITVYLNGKSVTGDSQEE